jgi:uncharacterized Zn-finger protein
MQITVEVSEELGQQLQQFQGRLQEIVERGLQELLCEQSGNFLDEKQIIAEKHRGTTEAENLALACPYCNRAKGTDLGSIDPETGKLTPFFNPRTQK